MAPKILTKLLFWSGIHSALFLVGQGVLHPLGESKGHSMRMGYAVKALVGASVSATLLMGVAVTPSHATAVTLTGTGPDGRSAAVTFDTFTDITTTYLKVTLTNTAAYDSFRPTDILTAIFFSLPGDPTLSRTAGISGATVPAGSDIKNAADVTNVGTEWAYRSGLDVGSQDFNQGISSIGTGLFGASNRFITCANCDLQGPDSPDGLQYGITTLSDPDDAGPGNDNGGLLGRHLIRNSVVFFLGGLNAGFDPATSITSVRFQYGTNLSEPHFGNGGNGGGGGSRVPYPSSLALLGFGALGAVLITRRRLAVSRVRS